MKVFQTTDLNRAAFIHCSDKSLLIIVTGELPAAFVFNDDEGEATGLGQAYDANPPIPARTYATSLAELKRRLFAAKPKKV